MKPTPIIKIVCMMLAAAAMGLSDPPATQPADKPTTAPAGAATFTLHGHVDIHSGIDVQKIDLTHVVVYLDSDPILDAAPISTEHAVVAQKSKQFVPKFVAVAKGTDVEFPNWDHISHNVFSRSAAAPAFDLDRYPYGVSKTRTFTKVGIVQVFCNIHPSMRAMIFVTPNPFFARADKDGKFQLVNVPAGHYTLAFWQERCGTRRQQVDAGPGHEQELSLSLTEDRNNILANDTPAHDDSYGTERGLGMKRETLNLPVVTESHPAPVSSEPCPNCK
jgi:plastocyanin